MKSMKKLLAFALVLVMLTALGATAFAADGQGTFAASNAMKGQTYTAYKVFNAVYADAADISKGVVYTVPSNLEAQVSTPFSVGTVTASNGEKIVSLASGTSDADVLSWVKSNYSKFDATGTALTYSDTDGTASATVAYGYYYVKSSLGSVVTIDSLNNAVTIVDKNAATPDGPTKKITAEDSAIADNLNVVTDATNGKFDDAAVGSVETFQISFNATNWVQEADSDTAADTATPDNNVKVENWVLTDTPTALNIDASTVAVSVNGTKLADTAFTVTGGGTSALTVTIPWTNATGASLYATTTEGSALIPVVVTYNAALTSDAAAAQAKNAVVVNYNTSVKLKDATSIDTYKFQIHKIKNEENNYADLLGAKFQLYYGDTLLKFDLTGTTYTFNATGSVDTIDLTKSASALIQGLDKADYTLKEIEAPAGYNKAEDKTVAAASLKKATETITDSTGISSDDGVANVINEQGTELPSTGGIGTTLFYVFGGILFLGAAVVLVARRRVRE